jgi:putative holliday junction resolvase
MKNFLSIDYGTKRIGLAVNVAMLAEPLRVISNQVDELNPVVSAQALSEITQICSTRQIDHLVLGMSEAAMAEKTKLFANLLSTKTKLPITLIDETLSSFEVGRRMHEAGFKLKKRQGEIDHYAAALILEDFLETL